MAHVRWSVALDGSPYRRPAQGLAQSLQVKAPMSPVSIQGTVLDKSLHGHMRKHGLETWRRLSQPLQPWRRPRSGDTRDIPGTDTANSNSWVYALYSQNRLSRPHQACHQSSAATVVEGAQATTCHGCGLPESPWKQAGS